MVRVHAAAEQIEPKPSAMRFLDDRLSLYPDHLRGGDPGDEPLVDVEAVRVRPQGIAGAKQVLTGAWKRYGLPVAITEAHLGCVPEEQARWLAEPGTRRKKPARRVSTCER
jgi:hypothetical protein